MNYKNICQYLHEKAKRFNSKVFLIDSKYDKRITYAEIDLITNQIAHFLISLRISKDDKVSILTRNCKEFLYLFFGCAKIGAVFNPINPDSSEDELYYIFDNADTKIIFINEDNKEKLHNLRKILGKVKDIFGIGFNDHEFRNFENEIKKYPYTAFGNEIEKDDPVLLMYSSGTTGNPKGIILTHHNCIVEGESMSRMMHLNENSICLGSLPLFFSGGFFPLFFATLSTNGTYVIFEKFSKSRFWGLIDKYKITFTYLVPTMLTILLNPPEDIKKYDTGNLKFIGAGAAFVPADLLTTFEKKFKTFVIIEYGLTENSAITSISPMDKTKRKKDTIGVPIDIAEMKIVDENNNEMPTDKEGEIIIKGPHVFKEYYKNPDATKKTLKNGWLHSGDLGYEDEDGQFHISGRIKEII